jgi:hypothetical protein
MDPVVMIDDADVAVDPGGQATVRVRVKNRSSIVEGFRLDVVGEASGWAKLYPAELEVQPQDEAETVVIFSPPAGVGSRAGQVPYGVRAVSKVDPGSSAVAEGDLAVGSVALSQASITPATSKGRFSGKHRVEMSNWGNAPVRLALEVSDPDEACGFLLTPDTLDLPVGTSGSAKLKVRARRPMLRGAPTRRQFRVVGKPLDPATGLPAEGPTQQWGSDPTMPAVDGAFEQRAIIGIRGLIPLVVLAVGAAATIGYLSTRKGGDEGSERSAPPVPTSFAAKAIANDKVQLSWAPNPRVDNYLAYTLDPATAENPVPTAVKVSEPIPSDQGAVEIGDLPAGSKQCFQLAAVRNKVKSARTEPQCVTTLKVGGTGAPAAPEGVQAVKSETEPHKAVVSWTDTSDGKASHIVRLNDTIVAEVEAPLESVTVDLVDGENCFQVQSKLGDATSPAASGDCITDEGGGTTGGTSTSDTLGGTGGTIGTGPNGTQPAVIALLQGVPLDDAEPEPRAIQFRDEFRAKGHPAEVLDTRQYPSLVSTYGAWYFVYLPFPTEDAANAYCTEKSLACQDIIDLENPPTTTLTTLPT